MNPQQVACCCDAQPPGPCEPGPACKIITATVCIGESEGEGCEEITAPSIELIVGPGSTAVASMDYRVMRQDLRVYAIPSSGGGPVDPGPFTDDGADGECLLWTHPYVPSSDHWGRGRKICKTIARFSGVNLVWQYDRILCQWAMIARNVQVEIGVAADIIETGTPEVGGTTHLRIEPDAVEIIECDIYLSPETLIPWCPGDEPETWAMRVAIQRSDGQPFPTPFNTDWVANDGIISGTPDYFPFPAPCNIVDPPDPPCDPYAWPDVYGEDPLIMTLNAPLAPSGALANLSGSGTYRQSPAQLYGEIDDATLFKGYAQGGTWLTVSGSQTLVVSNQGCDSPIPCVECVSYMNENVGGIPRWQLALVGFTVRRTGRTVTGSTGDLELWCDDIEGYEDTVDDDEKWCRAELHCISGTLTIVYVGDTDIDFLIPGGTGIGGPKWGQLGNYNSPSCTLSYTVPEVLLPGFEFEDGDCCGGGDAAFWIPPGCFDCSWDAGLNCWTYTQTGCTDCMASDESSGGSGVAACSGHGTGEIECPRFPVLPTGTRIATFTSEVCSSSFCFDSVDSGNCCTNPNEVFVCGEIIAGHCHITTEYTYTEVVWTWS